MGHLLTTAIERLSSISFENTENSSLESSHVLVEEYLRRVNQLLNEMDISIDQYPLFSFAKILGKDIDEKVYRACSKLDTIQNPYVKVICCGYLEVSELADQGVDEAIQYLDLYEPMLKLFERGWSFIIRQGEMVVGSSAYPLKYWRHLNISVQDISDIE
ncbi:hypothetical protein P9222_05800 [Paenibacillus amylolyticus]|uniref:hypothetical protein n=1 Tax=Paenibacillus sp. FSL R5-0749 TaxID=2921657 RepID=UPI00241D6271|nr:hypothetical protein [Paenibacillus amylolyticus]WFR63782.1 hypothetical protein P9222_05800 [Paenibacillus amylolyticus]